MPGMNLGCGLNEGLLNSKLRSIRIGALCALVPGLEARGEGPPLQVGLDQTGKLTEDGKKAKGS